MSNAGDRRLGRREFAAVAAGAIGSLGTLLRGTARALTLPQPAPSGARLTSRPRSGVATTLVSGPLGLADGGRDGVLQIPSAPADRQMPLVLFLHGATQSGAVMLRRIGAAAEKAGVVLLAPDSRETTWDAIRGPFGEDVAFIDHALDHVFAHVSIDPARIVIAGFSDGASYALSLGLANGDLCSRVIACSPGFVVPAAANGHPRFFVSHGTADPILPIDRCSRVIVPNLRAMGYDVTFREFDGRHEIPADVAREAFDFAAR